MVLVQERAAEKKVLDLEATREVEEVRGVLVIDVFERVCISVGRRRERGGAAGEREASA